MIKLSIVPDRPPLSWKSFLAEAPPFAIAIDGYVAEGPRYDPAGPRLNLNHHEHVSRLETRATCAQALMAVRQGLFARFQNERGNPAAHIFANDCDEDVCLTVFVLKNRHLVEHCMNPILNRLVYMEDALDTTGGAYPFPGDLPSMQELNWIFEPYRRFRTTGGLDRKIGQEYEAVVEDVGHRIALHLAGGGHRIELDLRYEVVHQDDGWTLVRETGMNARLGLFQNGIRAFIAVRERPDGRYVYTVGRQSVFVPFPVEDILVELNREEADPQDPWGGGNLIGGSPRVRGSKLAPEEVIRIVHRVVPAPLGA